MNGVTKTAAPGVGISFTLPTGTSYSYSVATIAVNAWVEDSPAPASGSGNAAASIAIAFTVQDLLTMAVSPAGSGTASPSTGWVTDGGGTSISAGAAAGYAFSAWAGTLAARGAYSGSNNPQTVTPSGGGINETAYFLVTPTYAVTFSESGVQAWMPSWGVTLNGVVQTAAPGTNVVFNVPTGTSYSYVVPVIAVNAWLQDAPSPSTGSGSSTATIAVAFTVQDLLTMAVSPAGTGTVSPSTEWVTNGVGVSILAGAAAGYVFSAWAGSLAARGAYSGTSNPVTVTPSGGGINETADFVVAPTYTVTFSETGAQTWIPSWGVILNGVTKTAAPGVSISFSVATGTSYSYTVSTTAVNIWVQDSPSPSTGSGSAAATIAVAFTVQDQLTMAVSPAGSGVVSPGTEWVTDGASVSISAAAASGYAFSSWTGSLAARGAYSGANNPQTVTPSGGGINETADFMVTPTYAVTFSETGAQTWMPSWGVILNGVTKTAAPAVSITFNVPTGTSYSYTVATIAVNSWVQDVPTPASGSGSAAATLSVSFQVQDLLTMSVSPAASGSVSPGTGWVADSIGVSISAGPASGYAFTSWSGTPSARGAYSGTNDPQTVTPSGGGINETANFAALTSYTVSFSETGVQTWFPSWGVTLNGVSKTAAPGVGISFSVATGTTYSYTVATVAVNAWVQDAPTPSSGSGGSAASISVAFAVQDLLTMVVSPAASGFVSPATGWVADGVGVSISAGAAAGYAFSSWAGSPSARGAYSGTNDPQTITPLGGGLNETANFVAVPTVPLTFLESGLPAGTSWSVTLNGVTSSATGKNITFNATQATYGYSLLTPIAGGAGTQYTVSSPAPSGTTTVTWHQTVAVAYTTQYQLTTVASPAVGGTVSPASGTWYAAGSPVTVSAVAAAGYAFSSWTGVGVGAYSGGNDPATITMGSPITETANFASTPTVPVTFLESGLPPSTSWSVSLNGVSSSATGKNVTFNVTAGSYTYSLATPIAGGVGVQYVVTSPAAAGTLSVTWHQTQAVTYTTQYQLTTAASPPTGGTVSPASGGWYDASTSVTLSAVTAAGYAFTGWSCTGTGCYSGINDPATFSIAAPTTETASFVAVAVVPVTFLESGLPTGTSWSVILNGVAASATGQNITFNVTAGTYSYTILTPIAGGAGVQYVVTSPAAAGAITVSWHQTQSVTYTTQYQLTMVASPAGAGTVSPTSGGWYNAGSGVTLTAVAAGGYAFASWSCVGTGCYAGTNDPASFTISAATTETANFASVPTVPMTFLESGLPSTTGWSVTLNGVTTSATGANITFNVTQATYSYAIMSPISGGAGVQYVVLSPASSGTLTVTWHQTQAVAYATQYQLTTAAAPAGSGTVSPASGSWYTAGSSVTLSAVASTAYAFSAWSCTGTGCYAGTNDPATVTVGSPTTETADFVATPTVPVSFVEVGLPAGSSWSVTLNGVAASASGQNVTFNVTAGSYSYALATPISGGSGIQYVVSSPSAAGTLAVTWHQTQSVVYATQFQLTMTVAPVGGGTVSPSSGNWYPSGSLVTLTAVAASGYAFSSWSCAGTGCYSGTNDPATLAIAGPTTETGNFVATPTVPLSFMESGLPGGTSWSVTLNGVAASASGSNVTFNVTAGTYSYALLTPIPGGTGVQYVVTSPSAAGTVVVSWHGTQSVAYGTQYQLTMVAAPAGGGTVSPTSGSWYASGGSATLSAVAAAGYAFSSWSCTGTGCYAGTSDPATLTLAGPTTETADFVAVPTVPLTFLESGLPAGTSWSVTLNGVAGSATGQNITFNVTQASYSYAIAGPIAGALGVQYAVTSPAASGTLSVTWHATEAVVYTTEYQLTTAVAPSGSGSVSPATGSWSISGSSVTLSAVAAAGYVFSAWSCSGTGCYAGSSDPATFSIGGPTTETAGFMAVTTAPIAFLESGLPGGTLWSVALNGVSASSTGQNLTFNVTAGSYTYSVSTPIAGAVGVQYLVTSPSPSGTVTVGASHVTEAVTYSTQYQLTTTVAPLGGGAVSPVSGSWYDAGSTLTLTAVASSGYAFTSWTCSGTGCYAGTSDPASFAIAGPTTETANFAAVTTAPVSYLESGLPTGTPWSVSLNGVSVSSSGQNITFNATAGSYTYAISTPISGGTGVEFVVRTPSPSGTVTVGVSHLTQAVSYTTQYQLTTAVSPVGTGTVSPASGTWYDAGSGVTVTAVPSPGYSFSSWTCLGTGCYSGTNDPATFVIGGATTETANFVPLPSQVPVSFLESGLPGGTTWSVTLNGIVGTASGQNITFNVTAGTYGYSVETPIAGATGVQYVATSSASGTLTVGSSFLVQAVGYGTEYQLSTAATPAGSGSVSPTSGGWYASGATVSLTALPASGYTFSVWTCTGAGCYAGTNDPATLTMGAPTTETASFTAVAATYAVTFTESGLAPGTSWWVALNGATEASTTTTIVFQEPDGTYSYALETPVAGSAGVQYTATSGSGSVTVSGVPTGVAVPFATQYWVSVGASPAGGGSVSPSNGWTAAGLSVTLLATASPGWRFVSWDGLGNGNYSGTSDPATATANGPLTEVATFAPVTPPPPVRYEVSFVTNPATCGEVVFAGTGYGNGARVNVSAGSYGVSALACSGYVVSSIAAGGFVYWPGNGTARVSASGTLTALFSPQAPPSPGPSWLAGLVTPATSTVEVDGQAVTVDSSGHFNVTATPGTHTVTATASGYVGSGPLSVGVPVGSGAFVTITLSKQPSSSSTPTNLAGGAIPDWALLLLLILVIVGMAIVLAVTAQKRRKDRREKQELEAALIRASSASTTATEPDGAPPSSVESDPQATPAPAEEDPVHLAEDSQSPDG
ncbi:MAG: hypothetical protein KGI98_16110 [Euryarchaeota archaeon]|nr:hypothetical protein [Euryarchaeota archaeon]